MVPASVIDAPPQEWPTSRIGPSMPTESTARAISADHPRSPRSTALPMYPRSPATARAARGCTCRGGAQDPRVRGREGLRWVVRPMVEPAGYAGRAHLSETHWTVKRERPPGNLLAGALRRVSTTSVTGACMIAECAPDGDCTLAAPEIGAIDAMTPSPVRFTCIPPMALRRSRMMPFIYFSPLVLKSTSVTIPFPSTDTTNLFR
jgi:hypothetical protein